MNISKYIHSCILVEEGTEKILIDPGPFSFLEGKVNPEDFTGIGTILITHKHYDHYDADALKIILRNNPGAQIFCNQDTARALQEAGITAELLEDGVITRGSFTIKAFFAEHEPLPIPVPTNTAFLINDTFLHPGDSFDESLFKTTATVLALPVAVPWLTIVAALDFAVRYKPEHVIPVHDGFVIDFFTKRSYALWDTLLTEKGITFHALEKPGECIKL